MKKAFLPALIASLLLITLVAGCDTSETPEDTGDFAIYLTKNDIPAEEMPVLSYVEPAEQPLISLDDIVVYDWDTHRIELTADAYQRLEDTTLTTLGTSFLVCLDRSPVYWGAFWTPISSRSFDGVVILVPPFEEPENTIQIQLGYPSPDFYSGEDPRSNADIMQSLEQAGKLD
ncbi:MAG: hypothetical protein PVJ61_01280 [Dehalococcoidia bacterium]|jgi:hypothetical protein